MNIVNTPDRTMNTEALVQMMVVAQLSMNLWHAEEAAANARDAYFHDIRRYEELHGSLNRRLSPDAAEHAAIREFTAEKYKAHQVLKRKAYTTKCRLKKACWTLAFIQGRAARADAFLSL